MVLDLAPRSFAELDVMRSQRGRRISTLESELVSSGETKAKQGKELVKSSLSVAADGTVFFIGLAASPFTGGWSLFVSLYGGGKLAVDGHKCAKMSGTWWEARQYAKKLRQEIARLRGEVEEIEEELARRG